MTRYTVVWVASAQEELADVWLTSAERDFVTAAAHGIDQDLAVDASTKGVEIEEGLRAFFLPPLKVLFAIREDDRLVEVLRVRQF